MTDWYSRISIRLLNQWWSVVISIPTRSTLFLLKLFKTHQCQFSTKMSDWYYLRKLLLQQERLFHLNFHRSRGHVVVLLWVVHGWSQYWNSYAFWPQKVWVTVVFPKCSRTFIEFSEFTEPDKSLKHELAQFIKIADIQKSLGTLTRLCAHGQAREDWQRSHCFSMAEEGCWAMAMPSGSFYLAWPDQPSDFLHVIWLALDIS